MVSLEAISEAVPGSYLIANGIFHIFGECQGHAMAMAARAIIKREESDAHPSRPGHLADRDLDAGVLWLLAQQGATRVRLDSVQLPRHGRFRRVHPRCGE